MHRGHRIGAFFGVSSADANGAARALTTTRLLSRNASPLRHRSASAASSRNRPLMATTSLHGHQLVLASSYSHPLMSRPRMNSLPTSARFSRSVMRRFSTEPQRPPVSPPNQGPPVSSPNQRPVPPVSSPKVNYTAGPAGGGTGRPPPSTSSSSSSSASRAQETHRANESLRESIEATVRDTVRSAAMRRFTYGAAVFAALSALMWLFWDLLRPQFSRPVGEVATEALNVPEFQVSAEELSKAIVKQVLYDDDIRERATHFVEDLLSREATRRAFTDVVIRSLKSDEFRQNANQFSKELVLKLLADPKVRGQFEALVGYAISTEGNKEKWIQLLKKTAADDSFRASVNQLSAHTVHRLLNDENIEKNAERFLQELLSDSNLQAEGGNALWSMVKSAVTPSFFKKESSSSSKAPPLPPKKDEHASSEAKRKEEHRSSGTIIHPEAFNSTFSEYTEDDDDDESETVTTESERTESETVAPDGERDASETVAPAEGEREPQAAYDDESSASDEDVATPLGADASQVADAPPVVADASSTDESSMLDSFAATSDSANSSRDPSEDASSFSSSSGMNTESSTSTGFASEDVDVDVNLEQSELSAMAFASSNEEPVPSTADDESLSTSSVSNESVDYSHAGNTTTLSALSGNALVLPIPVESHEAVSASFLDSYDDDHYD